MPSNLYEILALAMRYVFVLLGGLIVWRAFSWLLKDRQQTHKRLDQLPDAGKIGELKVLAGSDQLMEGKVISVPYEGCLGFLRTCDIVIPVDGVLPEHLDFSFVPGKGLFIYPRKGCSCLINSVDIITRRDSRKWPMGHGTVLQVGEAVLRLSLFVGIDAPRHAPLQVDVPPMLPTDPPPPPHGNPLPPTDGYYAPGYPPQRDWGGQQGYPAPYPQQQGYRAPYLPQQNLPDSQGYRAPYQPQGSPPYQPIAPLQPGYPPVIEEPGRHRRRERRWQGDGYNTPEGYDDRNDFDGYDPYEGPRP